MPFGHIRNMNVLIIGASGRGRKMGPYEHTEENWGRYKELHGASKKAKDTKESIKRWDIFRDGTEYCISRVKETFGGIPTKNFMLWLKASPYDKWVNRGFAYGEFFRAGTVFSCRNKILMEIYDFVVNEPGKGLGSELMEETKKLAGERLANEMAIHLPGRGEGHVTDSVLRFLHKHGFRRTTGNRYVCTLSRSRK